MDKSRLKRRFRVTDTDTVGALSWQSVQAKRLCGLRGTVTVILSLLLIACVLSSDTVNAHEQQANVKGKTIKRRIVRRIIKRKDSKPPTLDDVSAVAAQHESVSCTDPTSSASVTTSASATMSDWSLSSLTGLLSRLPSPPSPEPLPIPPPATLPDDSVAPPEKPVRWATYFIIGLCCCGLGIVISALGTSRGVRKRLKQLAKQRADRRARHKARKEAPSLEEIVKLKAKAERQKHAEQESISKGVMNACLGNERAERWTSVFRSGFGLPQRRKSRSPSPSRLRSRSRSKSRSRSRPRSPNPRGASITSSTPGPLELKECDKNSYTPTLSISIDESPSRASVRRQSDQLIESFMNKLSTPGLPEDSKEIDATAESPITPGKHISKAISIQLTPGDFQLVSHEQVLKYIEKAKGKTLSSSDSLPLSPLSPLQLSHKYMIYIDTGNEHKAGSDGKVAITLIGVKGRTHHAVLGRGEGCLHSVAHSHPFGAGQTDEFVLFHEPLGVIHQIILSATRTRSRRLLLHPKWLCREVRVQSSKGDYYHFAVNQWFNSKKHGNVSEMSFYLSAQGMLEYAPNTPLQGGEGGEFNSSSSSRRHAIFG